MNKDIGNEYEYKLMDEMASRGWWCHLFAYKPEGQPCDVIALKNDVPVLIDVKHCKGDRFEFSNIRPNQRNCFELAHRRGNSNCGFAIYFEKLGCFRWLPYGDVKNIESWGEKGVRWENTDEFVWN